MLIIYIFLAVLLIITLIWEATDRQKLPDLPDCKHITNYCNAYGEKSNIKYVIKNQFTDAQSIEMLLSKIENDTFRVSKIVFWRMSLIISLVGVLFFWIYNKLGNIDYPTNGYVFLIVSFWFFNYWLRNYLDYHYQDHMNIRVRETIAQIKQKLNKNPIL